MGDVYQLTKKLCGEKNSTNIPVRNKQGTLLTAEKDQEIRWTEHFEEVLNRSDPTNIPEITEAEEDLDINLDTPSKEELVKAIQCLKNNKAPEKDQLSAELFKTDPSLTADILLPIFHKIWQNNTIPRTWTEGNIIKLPKRKAFDSIHRESLRKILRHYGIPVKIVQLVRMFYTEFKCSVGDSKDISFHVKSGVRQGCVMSSLLFILSIDWVMRSSLSDKNAGIRWTLFSYLEDLDHADDLALLSNLENNMQDKTSRLQQNAASIGLNINIKKTEVMALNCRVPPDIEINGNHLKCSSSFTYLGSTVTSEGGVDKDIQSRIGKARGAFVKLHNFWRSRNISRKTKMKLYNSCVLSVLLYGAECWRMTERDISRLSTFDNNCLRKICRIFWPQKITNIELHRTTGSEDMSTLLKRKRWRWIGHVLRKPADDLTRVAMRWTPEGKRKRGRPKNTWRRTIEAENQRIRLHLGRVREKGERQRPMENTSPCPMCPQCEVTDEGLSTSGVGRIQTIIEASKHRGDNLHIELQNLLTEDSDASIPCHRSCVSTYTSNYHIKRHLKRKGDAHPSVANILVFRSTASVLLRIDEADETDASAIDIAQRIVSESNAICKDRNYYTSRIGRQTATEVIVLATTIREKKLVECLYDFGVTSSYNEVMRFKASAAAAAKQRPYQAFLNQNCRRFCNPRVRRFSTRTSREQRHGVKPASKAVYMPLLDMVPSDSSTMMTAMIRAQALTDQTGHVYTVFTADQQLYRVLVGVMWVYPELFTKFIPRLGGMHLLMSFVGCVGMLVANSGLVEILKVAFWWSTPNIEW
ncbi:hypothetical protein ScPMuIL_015820 [Solemya velum]